MPQIQYHLASSSHFILHRSSRRLFMLAKADLFKFSAGFLLGAFCVLPYAKYESLKRANVISRIANVRNDSSMDEISTPRPKKSKPKIFCYILTTKPNHDTRARHVKATWGQRCDKLIFLSDAPDDSLPTVYLGANLTRKFLWNKTKSAFSYAYDNYLNDYDFFIKADDDTYVFMENFRHYLSQFDPNQPLLTGAKFKVFVKNGYMSGPCYALTRAAVKLMVEEGFRAGNTSLCQPNSGGNEDVSIGLCMESLNITTIDGRDKDGKWLFLPDSAPKIFSPNDTFPKMSWIRGYAKGPFTQGLNCCSPYLISAHKARPEMMYLYEFMSYRFRLHH